MHVPSSTEKRGGGEEKKKPTFAQIVRWAQVWRRRIDNVVLHPNHLFLSLSLQYNINAL